ncbi:MAG: ATP-binding cassette domain-containing protein, partial [Clostridia bacterium]|nr:ATP-binding cassette domain-containing protein [Clostridia bacterium]
MDNFIEFKNVTFSYDEDEVSGIGETVVKNFSLQIKKGDFVAVLGHNGCGKSTIAKLCNGINIPQSGQVLVDGIDTADEETINDIRQKVGMVFQNPDNQIVATIV